jgi:hypothetical protein
MKLRDFSKQIYQIARQAIGGVNMTLELGERTGDLKVGGHGQAFNLLDFVDDESDDLWQTWKRDVWKKLDVPTKARYDFYVYAGRGWESELVDNLGIKIEDGRITEWHVTGGRWTKYEAVQS